MKWRPKNKYVKIGLTAFLAAAASMLFYFILFRSSSLRTAFSAVAKVLNPIVYGFAIAYVLNPQMQFIENGILWIISRTKWRPSRKARSAIRIISTFLSAAIAILVIYGIFSVLIPGVVDSVKSIVRNFQGYINNVTDWVDQTFANREFDTQTNQMIVSAGEWIQDWFGNSLMPQINRLMENVTGQLVNMLSFFRNLFLGFIISIYVLISKDSIKARFYRIIYSLFNITNSNRIVHNLRFIDEKFGGFLIGKLIDSAIIGVICYIMMQILRMPYPLLIAVVIGVTNIIPFFGPFIGAIPCALLVFAVDPIKALIFLIFIIILQQIDGNLIGPRILGNSVGVSSFLVLVAIIIFGGMFGVTGMIIGVPLTAIIIAFLQSILLRRLMKKEVSPALEDYRNLEQIDPATRKPVVREKKKEKRSFYSRIKMRSTQSRSYDYPLEDRPWDRTAASVRAEDEAIRKSKEEESASFRSGSQPDGE